MDQEHHSLRGLAAMLSVAALLAGCRTPPALSPSNAPNIPAPAPQSPASVSPAAPTPTPAPPPRENHLSPATRSLVTQARALVTSGDLDAASSTLDRALRIEPNNPLVWIEVGRLRLAGGDRPPHQGGGRHGPVL